jgi:hypothetical protein
LKRCDYSDGYLKEEVKFGTDERIGRTRNGLDWTTVGATQIGISQIALLPAAWTLATDSLYIFVVIGNVNFFCVMVVPPLFHILLLLLSSSRLFPPPSHAHAHTACTHAHAHSLVERLRNLHNLANVRVCGRVGRQSVLIERAASRKTVSSSCSQHDNRVSTLNSLID